MKFEIDTDRTTIKTFGDFKLSDMAVAIELLMAFQDDVLYYEHEKEKEKRWEDFINMFNKS
jgi:hypothetical protein